MWTSEDDIPGRYFVFDMEWVGDSFTPQQTHVTQIAARCVQTGAHFSANVQPLASSAAVADVNAKMGRPTAEPGDLPATVLVQFIQWLREESDAGEGLIVLIAHNGIRFDAPVLLANAHRYGVVLPSKLVILDSLYHMRHHMRHHEDMDRYDLDSICESVGIEINPMVRHNAMYDVDLLHAALLAMSSKWGIPYISGIPHPVCYSVMLVHGIGQTVCMRLGTTSLLALCQCILVNGHSLDTEACTTYLESLDMRGTLPAINIAMIAKHIKPAAQRYLHYLD